MPQVGQASMPSQGLQTKGLFLKGREGFSKALMQNLKLDNASNQKVTGETETGLDTLRQLIVSLQKEENIEEQLSGSGEEALLEGIPQELVGQLKGVFNNEIKFEQLAATEQNQTQLLSMLTLVKSTKVNENTQAKLAEVLNKVVGNFSNPPINQISLVSTNNNLEKMSNTSTNQNLFNDIWKQVEVLVRQQGNSNQQPSKDVELKMLRLLEQWSTLQKQGGHSTQHVLAETLQKDGSSKEQNVWREMLLTFQKRNSLISQQQYATNSSVTSKDVGKWLTQALARYSGGEERLENKTIVNQMNSMHMSKVEQFIIHVNQTSNQDSMPKQLMEEFQKVLKSSKFLTQNGTMELSIKLRPANLGDMMVKLTQLNGEMLVKITVSSQVAKEMLEGNMHQLRHMFSPQQVAVEKQDTMISQQSQLTEEGQKDTFEQSDHEQSQFDKDENQQDEANKENSFHEILLNEEV